MMMYKNCFTGACVETRHRRRNSGKTAHSGLSGIQEHVRPATDDVVYQRGTPAQTNRSDLRAFFFVCNCTGFETFTTFQKILKFNFFCLCISERVCGSPDTCTGFSSVFQSFSLKKVVFFVHSCQLMGRN